MKEHPDINTRPSWDTMLHLKTITEGQDYHTDLVSLHMTRFKQTTDCIEGLSLVVWREDTPGQWRQGKNDQQQKQIKQFYWNNVQLNHG